MATFMTLPREIRDTIITIAIQSSLNPPTLPLSPDRIPISHEESASRILIPSSPSTHSTSHALLLVNKELHYQTSALLERLKDTLSYTLDLTFVNEQHLAATWLCTPPPRAQFLPSLILSLRARGTSRDKLSVSGFADRGYGSPLGWALESFLRHFLTHGMAPQPTNPTAKKKDAPSTSSPAAAAAPVKKPKKVDKALKKLKAKKEQARQCFCEEPVYRYAVRSLHLDITTPELEPGEEFAPAHLPICEAEWPEGQEREGRRYVVGSHALADWVLREIGLLLTMQNFRPKKALFERVGEMRISLDGQVLRTYELGEMIDEAYGAYEWCRRKTIKARKEAGLL